MKEAVNFFCKRETEGVLQPDKLASDKTVVINDTAVSVLAWKHTHTQNTACYKLDAYGKTPIFIFVDITEDVVKLVARKLVVSLGSGGTDSEALQGWLLKFVEDRKRLHTSAEHFVDWLANRSPAWAAYHEFMSGRLIALDK